MLASAARGRDGERGDAGLGGARSWPGRASPPRNASDAVLTIAARRPARRPPSACARQYAAALRESRKWPRRWTRITSSHSSSERLKSIRSRVMPALLTTMSRRPKPSTAAASMASAVARSPTSPATIATSPPRARDLLGGLVGGAGQVVEHDARAGVGQRERLGAAEPGAGAGDDRDLAVQGGVVLTRSVLQERDRGARAGSHGALDVRRCSRGWSPRS